MNNPIQSSYDLLLARWGKQHWWPSPSALEMMIGAILTQNTAWANVEKAMNNLRTNDALTIQALKQISPEQLAEWIRPAGYFNQKAKYIAGMIATIHHSFDSSIDQLFKLDTPTLRSELLSWKGVGAETADCILLYGAKRPVFVVDSYTRRFLSRHHWCKPTDSYDAIARLFTDSLPADTQLFNEYHALIVRLGKEYCRTKPACDDCPLKALLPRTTT